MLMALMGFSFPFSVFHLHPFFGVIVIVIVTVIMSMTWYWWVCGLGEVNNYDINILKGRSGSGSGMKYGLIWA